MNNKLLFLVAIIPLLVLAPTLSFAKQSDTNRYDVGYTDGSNAATSDSSYNAVCDPGNTHLQNGHPHTTFYCNGWANGYTATWNNNHVSQASVGPIIGQSQSPGALAQGQGQGSSNTCINVVNCNPSTNQKQGASGEVNNGQ